MEKTLVQGSLVLVRVFAIAPEKVWRAWTVAVALRIWFGQADSPVWAAELDVRPGGRYRLVLREPNGAHYAVHGVYREVVPHRKLVFTWIQKDTPFDGEALVTVDLRPLGNATELRFTLDPVFDPRAPDAWRSDFKRLGHLLQPND
jgi:uncharacterized protein YndB with AHSA1/START domain